MKKLVYILTEGRYIAPESPSAYAQQILTEEAILAKALEANGINAERANWSDPDVDWAAADAAIFRSTWDYFDRFDEFKKWFDETSKKIRFINAPETLLWNMDKHYLQDLEAKGLSIVPSLFMKKGSKQSLAEVCAKTDWQEFILKPCVSGCARHTYRINQSDISAHESILNELLQNEGMMLQEFHSSIMEQGEVSHMVMGGRYTHSILKKAKSGDFRVQDDFGGSVVSYEANAEEIVFAEKCFQNLSPMPLYGRVDIMWNADGKLMISELEVIEPELWFRYHPAAANRLAEAVLEYLKEN